MNVNFPLCSSTTPRIPTGGAFKISALDGGKWLASCRGHFTLSGRAPKYPLNKLGGPQSHSGHDIGRGELSTSLQPRFEFRLPPH